MQFIDGLGGIEEYNALPGVFGAELPCHTEPLDDPGAVANLIVLGATGSNQLQGTHLRGGAAFIGCGNPEKEEAVGGNPRIHAFPDGVFPIRSKHRVGDILHLDLLSHFTAGDARTRGAGTGSEEGSNQQHKHSAELRVTAARSKEILMQGETLFHL